MPVRIFKMLKSEMASPISLLINASFKFGRFPDSLKIARITPIFKKGDNKFVGNYRPIASLPYISKIFERSVANRLASFFKKFSIINKSQFGFQKHKSTCDALINLSGKIYENLNKKEHTINVLIDLSKAFDTVKNEVLLAKLYNYGIRGLPLSWFRSFISDRKQYVKIGNSNSSLRSVNIGVPQGSILAPILFLIYINDLANVSEILSPTLFADDTTLTISHNNYTQMVTDLNAELKLINEWTKSNRLTINVDKTEMILITNRQCNNGDNDIKLDDQYLKFTENCMFLGVKLDNKLTFCSHIKYITSKLARSTGIFYKIRDNFTLSAKLNFYYAFMYPFFSYNIIVWGGTFPTHLKPLITQQKRFIRLMADADMVAHTNPYFYQFKILKLHDVYRYFMSIYMFNLIKVGTYKITHGRVTRNMNLAQPSFQRLTLTQHSVSYAGPKIWNEIPQCIRNISSLQLFKKKFRSFLINQYNS